MHEIRVRNLVKEASDLESFTELRNFKFYVNIIVTSMQFHTFV